MNQNKKRDIVDELIWFLETNLFLSDSGYENVSEVLKEYFEEVEWDLRKFNLDILIPRIQQKCKKTKSTVQ